MREALHIFRKDVRAFLYEISVLLLLAALWVLNGPEPLARFRSFNSRYVLLAWAVWLLVVAWWMLIVRIIQAEPLADHRTFWLTRPYRRGSLFAAKAISILLFVNLSTLLAQSAIIAMAGFSPLHYAIDLAWEQLLITSIVILPALVLAVLTSGYGQFLLAALLTPVSAILLGLCFGYLTADESIHVQALGATYTVLLSVLLPAATAASVLIVQYSWRRTRLAWCLAICGIVVTVFALTGRPLALVLPEAARSNTISIARDPEWMITTDPANPDRTSETVRIPLRITGLDDGSEIRSDAIRVNVETGHSTLHPSQADIVPQSEHSAKLNLIFKSSDYGQIAHQPIRIRVAANYTTFVRERSMVLPPDTPTDVAGVGRCLLEGDATSRVVSCRAPFRGSSYLVAANFGRDNSYFARPGYSSIPDLTIDPLVTSSLFQNGPAQIPWPTNARLSLYKVSAHLYQEFEMDNVRMDGR